MSGFPLLWGSWEATLPSQAASGSMFCLETHKKDTVCPMWTEALKVLMSLFYLTMVNVGVLC